MLTVTPCIDPDMAQAVASHPEVWPGLQSSAPDPETAVREYITQPGCTFFAVHMDGQLAGGYAVDRVSDTAAMGHNLLFPEVRGAQGVEAFNLALCWVFGRLGYQRLYGLTDKTNTKAVRYATSMVGMSRCHKSGSRVLTAINAADWPWRHPHWCMSGAFAPDMELSPTRVMLGVAARLAAVGAIGRGAEMFNEWAVIEENDPMQIVAASEHSAIVRVGDQVVLIGADGAKEIST
ncbi:MAG: hypothetical protein LAT50_12180 [Ectothiorhodospiraceae bacterium]|nr:hypothetical protein [Ectothiorhodospiraceae bacterium]